MIRKIPALVGAFVTLSVIYMIAGLVLFDGSDIFGPSPTGPLVPPVVGFVISNGLYVLFYSWVVEQMGHPVKAALTVAVSQLLLVDVDYVLGGERTVAGGAASAVALLVAWSLVGLVYQALSERGKGAAAERLAPQ